MFVKRPPSHTRASFRPRQQDAIPYEKDYDPIRKYRELAQEANRTGDRVLAETFYQKAEYFLRENNEAKRKKPPLNKRPSSKSDFEMSIEQELSLLKFRK